MHIRVVVPFALAVGACAPPPAPAAPAPAPAPAPAAAAELPRDVRWFRRSAEARAAFLQGFRLAELRLREMAPRGGWAVILDADETLLDNSAYQERRARAGRGYDTASWNAWVRERAAPPLPGAAGFARAVREMGGRVVIVTNRFESTCGDTRANLAAAGIAADAVLCLRETGDKNPRFRAVQEGTAAPGLPPLRVVMWVGDNIQDFPALTQQAATAAPDALEPFGRSYVILPNPMYGSWERLE